MTPSQRHDPLAGTCLPRLHAAEFALEHLKATFGFVLMAFDGRGYVDQAQVNVVNGSVAGRSTSCATLLMVLSFAIRARPPLAERPAHSELTAGADPRQPRPAFRPCVVVSGFC